VHLCIGAKKISRTLLNPYAARVATESNRALELLNIYLSFKLETNFLEQMCPPDCRSSEKKSED